MSRVSGARIAFKMAQERENITSIYYISCIYRIVLELGELFYVLGVECTRLEQSRIRPQ
jgi:hypothetical protein